MLEKYKKPNNLQIGFYIKMGIKLLKAAPRPPGTPTVITLGFEIKKVLRLEKWLSG